MNPDPDAQPGTVKHVTVDDRNAGQRIDNFLRLHLKGVPKARIYKGLRKGEVRVNKGRVRQDYKLRNGDSVRIPPLRTREAADSVRPGEQSLNAIQSAILFEDRRLLALNKPPGWAVHGGSGQRYGIIEALRVLRPDAPYLELVHRLDRDTSGCLLIAKTRSTLTRLHVQLRTGRVKKSYLTLVSGVLRKPRLEISSRLRKGTLRSGERMVQTDTDGKAARTLAEVIDNNRIASLLNVRIFTGRTHQIRVHLTSVGHPIAGDAKYGSVQFNKTVGSWGLKRLFLHAHQLGFNVADEPYNIVAPLPPALSHVLQHLGLTLPARHAR